MDKFTPSNLDPIAEVIQRVRLLKKPNMHDIDCQALEKRFYDQDWIAQLDIYEVWLDIDNSYTLNCLFIRLVSGYLELLQELIEIKKSERAKAVANRIKESAIRHIRMQMIAFFVTTYMPIDVVRKYKKTLSRYLDMAYCALVERLGGDSDFQIDKDMLVPRLAYYGICSKFNLETTDEEALIDFKKFIESDWMQLSLDYLQDEYESTLNMSLLQNACIKNWYAAINKLGLDRMAKAFNRFDRMLNERILSVFQNDVSCVDFPGLPKERQYHYWRKFCEMAFNEIKNNENPETILSAVIQNTPEFEQIVTAFELTIEDPLNLDL